MTTYKVGFMAVGEVVFDRELIIFSHNTLQWCRHHTYHWPLSSAYHSQRPGSWLSFVLAETTACRRKTPRIKNSQDKWWFDIQIGHFSLGFLEKTRTLIWTIPSPMRNDLTIGGINKNLNTPRSHCLNWNFELLKRSRVWQRRKVGFFVRMSLWNERVDEWCIEVRPAVGGADWRVVSRQNYQYCSCCAFTGVSWRLCQVDSAQLRSCCSYNQVKRSVDHEDDMHVIMVLRIAAWNRNDG